jgi:hypothetical protein
MNKAWAWFAFDTNDRIVAKGYFRSAKGAPSVPVKLKAHPRWNAVHRSYVAIDAPYYVEAYARRANGYALVQAAQIGDDRRNVGLG